ncbi:MAG: S26 family signal peptidase [Thermoplasmata archaeon]
MPRRGEPTDPDDDADDDTSDPSEEDEAEETEERPTQRRPRPRTGRRAKSRPVRPWTIDDLDEEEDDLDAEEETERKGAGTGGFFQSLRRPVFFRARDSWYFEPLVALAIIVLLLVSLFAYTSTWPPIFVVESGSMQHGAADQVGLINTGDLVLVKKVNPSAVIPYVVGEETGYSTYGEYGDVILYHPNGDTGVTPVIHRAILYLVWNSAARDYSAPALQPLACGTEPGARYSVSGAPRGCAWTGLLTTLTLYGVGWRNATVTIPLGALGNYSGFVTMGDNNLAPGSPPQGETDQPGISALVAGSWIVGVARGMVPWVGSFKLLIDGNAGEVPTQSWQFLALTLSAIVLGGFGLHYLFRVEGIEDPRRLAEERAESRGKADEDEEGPDWEERPKGSRWKGLRAWLAAPGEEDAESKAAPTHAKKHARPASSRRVPAPRSRGRPRPAVRKSKGLFHRSSKRKSSKDSDDESL